MKCGGECCHKEDCRFDHDANKCLHAADVNAEDFFTRMADESCCVDTPVKPCKPRRATKRSLLANGTLL